MKNRKRKRNEIELSDDELVSKKKRKLVNDTDDTVKLKLKMKIQQPLQQQQEEEEEETYTRDQPLEEMKIRRDVMRFGGEHELMLKYSNQQENEAKELQLMNEILIKPQTQVKIK